MNQNSRPAVAPFPYEQRQPRSYKTRTFISTIAVVNATPVTHATQLTIQPTPVTVLIIQNPSLVANMIFGFSSAIGGASAPGGFVIVPLQSIQISTEVPNTGEEIEVFDLSKIYLCFTVAGTYRVPYIWSLK